MEEDVGTCCSGKQPHEMCRTCREEYETWRQSKDSDKDYSRVKQNRKKMKKQEDSPYTKDAIRAHQKKMREMDRSSKIKGVNVSNEPKPNQSTVGTSSEDIWPKGISWQNKILTKNTIAAFLQKASKALIKKEFKDALESLIKENTNDDSDDKKVMATPLQWERAKAEKPYYGASREPSEDERKAFSARRDAALRAKFNMPSKEQVEKEAELKRQKKEAAKQAFTGDSGVSIIPETLNEKTPDQVKYERALMRQHEQRMQDGAPQKKPSMVVRRSPSGGQTIVTSPNPSSSATASPEYRAPAAAKGRSDSPADLTEEEQNKLEEMMNNIALAHQRKKPNF